MEDTERLTLGLWVDFIIDCINMEHKAERRYKEKNDPTVAKKRKATQLDFDMF